MVVIWDLFVIMDVVRVPITNGWQVVFTHTNNGIVSLTLSTVLTPILLVPDVDGFKTEQDRNRMDFSTFRVQGTGIEVTNLGGLFRTEKATPQRFDVGMFSHYLEH